MIVDHPTQIPVDLPKVSNAGELQDSWREDAMFIGITRDGKTYFNTTQIGTAELSHFIRDGLNRGSKPRLYFRVDARAKTGTFLEAFDEVRKTGIEYIAIVTERREAPMPH